MKILSFDTTAKAVCAAICEDEQLLSSYFAELPGVHTTETLLPAIELMLKNAGLTMDDVELKEEDQVIEELKAVDINTISPYEAMSFLFNLQKRLK